MDDLLIAIIIISTILLFAIIVLFITNGKKRNQQFPNISTEQDIGLSIIPMTNEQSQNMIQFVEEIEITNKSGSSFKMSKIAPEAGVSTMKYREIMTRSNAVVANVTQGAMPVLSHLQTLEQIQKSAPNGLFSATAPLGDLMKYSDGTMGSIVVGNNNIKSHSGFKKVDISSKNPAAIIGSGMHVMAMISGQYYMDDISKRLSGIEHGIEKLIGFHHDANIGKLKSLENRIREIVGKTHVDESDIIALQSGITDADGILMEYTTRLKRLSTNSEITDRQVAKFLSRLFTVKDLKKLRTYTEENELYCSFQICLLADKLMLEGKKAEFATRLKLGETEKALEAFNTFTSMHEKSFINNATDLLKTLYQPINDKAKTLVTGQLFKSKKARNELNSIDFEKSDLKEYISSMSLDDSNDKMISNFTKDIEIIYVPSEDGLEQRMFISDDE